MAISISKREVVSNYKVFEMSYSLSRYLLRYNDRIFYSSRSVGWACDYFFLGDSNILISVGDSPCGKVLPRNEVISEIFNKANIVCNSRLSSATVKSILHDLQNELAKELSFY